MTKIVVQDIMLTVKSKRFWISGQCEPFSVNSYQV